MDVSTIENRFNNFISQFERDDIDMVMCMLEHKCNEYNRNKNVVLDVVSVRRMIAAVTNSNQDSDSEVNGPDFKWTPKKLCSVRTQCSQTIEPTSVTSTPSDSESPAMSSSIVIRDKRSSTNEVRTSITRRSLLPSTSVSCLKNNDRKRSTSTNFKTDLEALFKQAHYPSEKPKQELAKKYGLHVDEVNKMLVQLRRRFRLEYGIEDALARIKFETFAPGISTQLEEEYAKNQTPKKQRLLHIVRQMSTTSTCASSIKLSQLRLWFGMRRDKARLEELNREIGIHKDKDVVKLDESNT